MSFRSFSRAWFSVVSLTLATASVAYAAGARVKVIYTFQGGTSAAANLIADKNGNLYVIGGGGSGVCSDPQSNSVPCGSIFRVSPPPTAGGAWSESELYSFQGRPSDGAGANGPLLLASHGIFYGSTNQGGNGSGSGSQLCGFPGIVGCGTIFRLSPPTQIGGAWTETVLYNFQGTGDGESPFGRLAMDAAGNLFGVTSADGTSGGGVMFELSPPSQTGGSWTETVLHQFGQQSGDGLLPSSGLIRDAKGNLYGITEAGGSLACNNYFLPGCGVVYRLSPPSTKGGTWTETVLYSFTGSSDGQSPRGELALDSAGNLYGMTDTGMLNQPGTIFRLSPPATGAGPWNLTTLYAFKGHSDGGNPLGGVIFDKQGNLYGTTEHGGDDTSASGCQFGCGTIFEISPAASGWTEQVLYRFHQNNGVGFSPVTGLVFGRNGNLFGSTDPWTGGGVFQLSRSAK
jgi:uncharacterized repeat protein (TIGR03803 family)